MAVVDKLHANGYHVAIHYNSNKSKAQQLLSSKGANSNSFIIRGDLSNEQNVELLVEEVSRKFSSLEIIVNAATLSLPMIKFEEGLLPECCNSKFFTLFRLKKSLITSSACPLLNALLLPGTVTSIVLSTYFDIFSTLPVLRAATISSFCVNDTISTVRRNRIVICRR